MRKIFTVVALLLASAAGASAADEYKIDSVHSNIGFSVRHMMVTNVPGRFTDYSGLIKFDEKDPSKSSVEVAIKIASVNTDNTRRDDHLRTSDFFDAQKFPEATFKSKRVEKRGEQWVAIGDLTLRGVTKEIELPFEIVGHITDGRGNKRLGISATTTINRMDYGVNWQRPIENVMGGVSVSEKVKLTFELQAVKPAAQPAQPAAAK